MKKWLLLSAVFGIMAFPTSGFADTMSQDIVLGPYNAGNSENGPIVATPLPIISVLPNEPMELHVINPTPEALTFSAPDLGVNVSVPANAERRVTIDPSMTANLAPGQQVAYYITNPAGDQIASSYMYNDAVALAYQTTTVTQTVEEDEEPTYTTTTRRSTVRGYW